MVRGKEERADLERVEAPGAPESTNDDLVEQGARPQEEAAVDRAAGDLVEGAAFGRESDLARHGGEGQVQTACQRPKGRLTSRDKMV